MRDPYQDAINTPGIEEDQRDEHADRSLLVSLIIARYTDSNKKGGFFRNRLFNQR
jgi:hypothetical protein